MKPIIEVKRVGKQYKKGIDRRYKSLRDSLGRLSDLWTGGDKETFWALQDISFNVERGESLGIIGRNGAGKSTLLKILARITPPTTGEIIMRGRVASLLEVGTGFHPELTGRENIFFNGSILGMRYHEIKKKFDEIVNFSGVETFLDTPLKHYSSGMQMRLAFSVAAHLDAEILLIDEVLAVGDAEFQKKCIGKMDEVSRSEGKTILFISHNLSAVLNLCNYSLLIEQASLKEANDTNSIIKTYLNTFKEPNNLIQKIEYNKNQTVKINTFNTINENFKKTTNFKTKDKIGILISYEVFNNNFILRYGLNIYNFEGVNIFDTHFGSSDYYKKIHPNGLFETIAWLPNNLLKKGDYFVGLGFFNHQTKTTFARGKDIISFTITEDLNIDFIDSVPGLIAPKIEWQQKKI